MADLSSRRVESRSASLASMAALSSCESRARGVESMDRSVTLFLGLNSVNLGRRGGLAENADGSFRKSHFRQGEQKRQKRFGSLVLIDAVHAQRVVAPSGVGIVKF